MLIKSIETKKLQIEILHNGIEIVDKKTGFKTFFMFYKLNDAKRKFKQLLKGK